jgi:predicted aspartyl protease
MGSNGEKKVGKFKVEIELANYEDMIKARNDLLPHAQVRRVKILGVVDSGATRLVLPQATVKELGLPTTGKVKVTYANGSSAKRPQVEGVYLDLLGRHGVFTASVEPKRDTALVGAIVLEDLDFLVDCSKARLYPRDPDFVVSEIE